MHGPEDSSLTQLLKSQNFFSAAAGGLFLDPFHAVPPSLVSFFSSKTTLLDPVSISCFFETRRRAVCFGGLRGGGGGGGGFLSVGLSIKKRERHENRGVEGEEFVGESGAIVGLPPEEMMEIRVRGSSAAMDLFRNEHWGVEGEEFVGESGAIVIGYKSSLVEAGEIVYDEGEKKVVQRVRMKGCSGAMNMIKHLWAGSGAVAAMVSSRFVGKSEEIVGLPPEEMMVCKEWEKKVLQRRIREKVVPRIRVRGSSAAMDLIRNEIWGVEGEEFVGESGPIVIGYKSLLVEAGEVVYDEGEKKVVQRVRMKGSSGAMNMTKHLWAGAVAAMVSRFAPLFLFKKKEKD